MLKRKRTVKSKDTKFDDFCTHFSTTDKSSYRICLETLEKLYNHAWNANKRPLIVIGIRRNSNEIFTITGEISVEKQKMK